MALKKVLLAVHNSEASARAVEFTARMLVGTETEVIILDVMTEGKLMSEGLWDRAKPVYETLATEVLAAAATKLSKSGIDNMRVEIGDGDPAEVILDMAKRENVDVIIIGRHKRGLLWGMVTDDFFYKVCGKAKHPVLAI